MADTEDLYALLNISQTATDQEIRTAYRQKSLKVHPDRNPSPEAASLFNQLFEAYELLKDHTRRAKYDLEINSKRAKAQRFAALDNKRKSQVADLNDREEAFKRSKDDEHLQKVKMEDLRQEAQRLMRERATLEQQRQKEALASTATPTRTESHAASLSPLDTTLKLKWSLASYPDMTNASLSSLLSSIISPDKDIESLLISKKVNKKSDTPQKTAVMSLKTLSATVKLVQAFKQGQTPKDISIDWAAGEVPKLARAAMGLQDVMETPSPAPPKSSVPPSFSFSAKSEDDVLARMRARQEERQRLEDEIRRQEAED